MRYKITIEYDGTNLLGWQRQVGGLSVQGYLETAINSIVSPPKKSKDNYEPHPYINVLAAGRTDAGVHALKQVAHFDLYRPMKLFNVSEAINFYLRKLKAPISIIDIEEVDEKFHARYSATGRGYIYRLLNRKAPPALNKDRVWWVSMPLDITKMQEASQYFLGLHDFSSFRAAQCEAPSPMKSIERFEIEKTNDEIIFHIESRSFLHHQVRAMVGTLKMVGEGYFKPEDIKQILEAKDRKAAGANAPSHGLYLNKVEY